MKEYISYPPKVIPVVVSVTMSKTVNIRIDDYIVNRDIDEDGPYEEYDYSECNLVKLVEEQIELPQDKVDGWHVDEMEVILE